MLKNIFKKINKKKNGYTLIETMIAVSLFIVIVTIGMNALLNANILNQKSKSMRSILDNLSFVMEDMSRNLRTGTLYQCITSGSIPSGAPAPTSCTVGGGIYFQTAGGSDWGYYIGANPNVPGRYSIFRIINGPGATSVQMTPDEVNINLISGFSVLGAETASSGNGNRQQPFVTIRLTGTVISVNNVSTAFYLQTSVSQRALNYILGS